MKSSASISMKTLSSLIAFTTLLWSVTAYAGPLPADPNCITGCGSYTVDGTTGTYRTGAQQSITEWNGGFNIAHGYTFNAFLPGNGVHLSRDVNGTGSISEIFGAFNVPSGKFFLVNVNGIVFGANAAVNAAGLIASTLDIDNDDFMNSIYKFKEGEAGPGFIQNLAKEFNIGEEGLAFLAGAIENDGIIGALESTVNLASGKEMTVTFEEDGLISVVVDEKVASKVQDFEGNDVDSGVSNSGIIRADGGYIFMTSEAKKDIFTYLVNQEGVLEANTVVEKDGYIELASHQSEGIVVQSGTINAKGDDAGEEGGTVKVLGEKVAVLNSDIDVSGDAGGGEILVGGNYQGKGEERNADYTFVSSDSSFNADAGTNGDGGDVIIWSDKVTSFYGDISARGGDESGDGGFAEVSGKDKLAFHGDVDLLAPNGEIGTLLLDPATITITGGTFDNQADGTNTFAGDPSGTAGDIDFGDTGPSTVHESEIEGLDANIILEAETSISTSGTFTDTDLKISNNRSLTMRTRNNNADGSGGIDLTSSADGANLEIKTQGTGSITLEARTEVASTQTGDIKVSKLSTEGGSITIDTNNGTIELHNDIDTTGGATPGLVDINGAVDLKADVTIDTNVAGTGASVDFESTIDGGQTLIVDAGDSSFKVAGDIGATTALTGLTVDANTIEVNDIGTGAAAGVVGPVLLDAITSVTFTGTNYNTNGTQTYTAAAGNNFLVNGGAATNFTTSDDAITFNTGTVLLSDGSDLTVTSNGGAIAINGGIDGTSSEDVTLNSSGGTTNTVSVGAIGDGVANGINTVNITGTSGVTLNGNITTSDAAGNTVDVTGPVTLGANIVIDTDNATNDGDVNINGTINGNQSLNIQADSADVDISGVIGGTAALTQLDIDGNEVEVNNIGTGAADGVSGTTTINAASSITFDGTNYRTGGTQTYTAAAGNNFLVNGGAATNFTTSDDAITFNTGTVLLSDGSDLTVTSNGGAIAINGGIDGTSSEDVTLNSSGGTTNTVSVGAIGDGVANGINTVNITGTSGVTLNGNITTSDAAGNTVDVTGPVTLGANIVIDTDNATNDGDVNINGTINGNQSLNIQADSADVDISGVIGGTAALTQLDIDGNEVEVNNIGTGAADGVSGTTTINAASSITFDGTNYRTGGTQTYTAAAGNNFLVNGGAATNFTTSDDAITFNTGTVLLSDGSDLTVTSNGGAIAINGGIDGTSSEDVTLNSSGGTTNTVSVGAIGDGVANGINTVNITGTSGVTLNGNITTSDAAGNTVDVTGPITLGADVDITTNNATNDGDVTLNGTVNGNQALDIDAGSADVDISGVIGGTAALTQLDIDGNEVEVNNIGTGAADGVSGTTTINAASSITFDGTNYRTGGTQTYTAAAGNNFLVNGGAATNFTTSDDAITFNTGTVLLSDGSDLTVTSNGGAIAINGGIDGTSSEDVTLNSSGGTTNTVSVGAIGDGVANGINTVNITGTSGVTLNGNITTSDAAGNTVDVTGPITLGADVDITTNNATNDGDVTLNGTVNGNQALDIDAGSADVDISGVIGGTAALTQLDIDGNEVEVNNIGTGAADGVSGTTTINAASSITFDGTNYRTGGTQTYTAAAGNNFLVNGGAATNFTTSDDAITFNTGTVLLSDGSDLTVTSNGGAIAINGGIDGTSSEDVTLNSSGGTTNTVSVGAIGDGVANGINTVNITGTSGVTLNGNITTSDAAGNTVDVTGPITLGADVDITTNNATNDGDVTLNGTVNGNQALDIDAGSADVDISGVIGGTAALTQLDIDGNEVEVNNIGTGAADGVSGTTTINAASSITFDGTNYRTGGTQTYTAAAGNNFLVNGGAATNFTTSDDAITFNTGTVLLSDGSDLTVTSNGGAIAINGGIDGTSSEDVTLNSSGGTTNTVSVGAIGDGVANGINTVNITGTSGVTLNGNITTSDAAGNTVDVTGPITLGADVDITTNNATNDGDVTLNGTVNGNQALDIDAGSADVDISGVIGGTAALTQLDIDGNEVEVNNIGTGAADGVSGTTTINAASSITFDGTNYRTGGTQTYTAAAGNNFLVNGGAATNFTTSDDAITFNTGTVLLSDGSDLTVTSNGGAIAINGGIDGTSSEDVTLNSSGGTTNTVSVGAIGDGVANGINTVNITGTSGVTLNGNITTSDAAGNTVDVTGPITLGADVDITTNNATNDGDVTLNGTVNGNQALDIDAGSADVDISGVIGGTAALTQLDIDGNEVEVNNIGTGAADGVSGTTTINAASSITFDGTNYRTGGTQTYTAAAGNNFLVNGGAATNFTTSDDAITFNTGTVLLSDGSDLTVTSNGGAIAINGGIDGTSSEDVTLNSSGGTTNTVSVGAIGDGVANGINTVNITGTSGVTLNGNITTSDAAGNTVDVTGPITLGADVDITTNNATNDGDVTLNGTVNGNQALDIDAGSADVDISGVIGGTAALTQLDIDGNEVEVNNIGTGAADGVSGTTTINAASSITFDGTNYRTGGTQTYTAAAGNNFLVNGGAATNFTTSDDAITFNTGTVLLSDGSDLTVTSNGGAIAINGGIDGTSSEDVTLNSSGGTTNTVSVGAIGDGVANGINTVNITGTSGVTLNGNITTSDAAGNTVDVTGPITLGADVDITTNNATNDGDVTLNGTVNGNQALDIDAGSADVDISGVIGGTAALTQLDIDGNEVEVNNIGTGAADGVSGTTTINAASSITFDGTNYRTGGTQTYTAAAGNNFLVNGGAATNFTTSDDAITFNTGTVLLSDGSDLTVTSNGGAIAINGGIDGTSSEDVTLNSSGGTTNTVSVGAIGDGVANGINTVNITGTSGVTLNGNITTSDAAGNTVDVTGPITLGADVDITTNNATNDGDVTLNGTVNGNQALDIDAGSADVDISGVIGGTAALTQLDIDGNEVEVNNIGTGAADGVSGTTTINAASSITFDGTNYRTGGTQTYTAAAGNNFLVNGGAATNFTTSDDAITFNTGTVLLSDGSDLTVTSNGGAIAINGGIDGTSSEDVTLNSSGGTTNTVSVGAIGDGVANGINTVNITGTSGVTLNGNITTSDAAGNTVDVTGPITLGADVDITTNNATNDGDVTLNGTVNGNQALDIDAGSADVDISGVIGGTAALTQLDIDGNEVEVNNIGTGAADGVSGTTTINAASSITFDGTNYRTGGTQTYTAAAGNNFLVNGGAATNFTTSDDAITFNTGTVLLSDGSDLTVTSNGGAIAINGGIDGTSSEDVTLNSSGGTTNTVSVGAIGDGVANGINTVNITGTSGVTLNGNITTSDAAGNTVDVTGPVTLGANIVIDTDNATNDGDVNINGTINGNQSLNIQADSADVDISGVIGGTAALTQLDIDGNEVEVNNIGTGAADGVSGTTTINAASSITFDGTNYRTGGTQTYTAAAGNNFLVNGGAATNFTTSDDAITFNTGTVLLSDGSDLTVTSNGGAIAINGGIDGTSSEDVTLNSSGGTTNTVSVGAIGDGVANGINTVNITGTSGVTLNGNITTSDAAGNTVDVTGPVTLGANIVIDTDNATNDGDVNINGTINGNQSLNIQADSADVDISGVIGGTAALTQLDIDGNEVEVNNIGTGAADGVSGTTTINAASSITFDGTNYRTGGTQTYTAAAGNNFLVNGGAATNFTTSDDAITFNTGTVLLSDGSDLTVTSNGGAIAINGGIDGTSSEDVTLNSSGGTTNTVSVGAIGDGVANGINTVLLQADTRITLNGNITTSNQAGNTVTLQGPTVLGADITIDTNTAGSDGKIDFQNTLDGAQNLVLDSGAADIDFDGAIGDNTQVASILINDAKDVNFASTGKISGELTQTTGTGKTTFNDAVETGNDIDVRNASIDFANNGSLNANSGASNILLRAITGAITDSTPTENTLVTANELELYAATGVGSQVGDGDIETAATRIESDSQTSGDIVITELDGVNLVDIDTNDGDIVIVTGGDTTATLVRSDTGVAGAHDITLTVNGGNLSVGSIQSDDEVTVDVPAGNVTTLADDGVADIIGTTIDVTGRDGIGTALASLDVTATTSFNADTTNSDIFVDSIGDLPIGLVDAGTANVTLDSTANMNDANGDPTVNIRGSQVSLTAVTGIGDGDALEIDLQNTRSMSATTQSGDIQALITSDGDVTMTNASVTAGAGDIDVRQLSDFAFNVTNASTTNGEITLRSISDLVINGIIRSQGALAGITLAADSVATNGLGDLIANVGSLIDAGSGPINLSGNNMDLLGTITTSGALVADAQGSILMNLMNTGTFDISAGGNVLDANGTGPNLFATGNSVIDAGGFVGVLLDPIEFAINGGDLSVFAQSALNGVSASLEGSASGSVIPGNLMPGLFMFTNLVQSGDTLPDLTQEIANQFNLIAFQMPLTTTTQTQSVNSLLAGGALNEALSLPPIPAVDNSQILEAGTVVVSDQVSRQWVRRVPVVEPVPVAPPAPVAIPRPVPVPVAPVVAPEEVIRPVPTPAPPVQITQPVVEPTPVVQPVPTPVLTQPIPEQPLVTPPPTVTPALEVPPTLPPPVVAPILGPRLFQGEVEEEVVEEDDKEIDEVMKPVMSNTNLMPKNIAPPMIQTPTLGPRMFQVEVEEKVADE